MLTTTPSFLLWNITYNMTTIRTAIKIAQTALLKIIENKLEKAPPTVPKKPLFVVLG